MAKFSNHYYMRMVCVNNGFTNYSHISKYFRTGDLCIRVTTVGCLVEAKEVGATLHPPPDFPPHCAGISWQVMWDKALTEVE